MIEFVKENGVESDKRDALSIVFEIWMDVSFNGNDKYLW